MRRGEKAATGYHLPLRAAEGWSGDAREPAQDRMFPCPRKGPLSSHRHRERSSGEASPSDLSISLHRPKSTGPLGPRFIPVLKETVREANLCPEVENKLPPSLENPSPLSSFFRSPGLALNTLQFSVRPHPSPSSPRPKKAAAWLGVARPPARRSRHHGLRESGSRRAPRSPAPSECGGSGWLGKGDRAPPGRARMRPRPRPRREWWGRP